MTDRDEELLFMDDISRMTGWHTDTVKHYATVANRARREGKVTANYGKLIERLRKAEADVASEGATQAMRSKLLKLQADARLMPAPHGPKVRRELVKGDGKPLVVWTSRWLKSDIMAWFEVRGVKAGEPAG